MVLGSGLWNRLWNRRGRDRLEQRLEASIRVLDGDGGSHITPRQPAKVLNLSENGCCLALPNLALEGFHLHRCLESPEDFPLEVEISAPGMGNWRLAAQVRWVNRESEDEGWCYRLGAKFCGGQSLPGNWRRLLAAGDSGNPQRDTQPGVEHERA